MSFYFSFRRARAQFTHALGALACVAALSASVTFPALAQSTTYIDGVVTTIGAPAAGVDVTLKGSNLELHRITDATGHFSFAGLASGRYDVSSSRGDLQDARSIDLTGSGLTIELTLVPLREVGRSVVTARSPVSRSSGTDIVLNGETLAKLPNANSIPDILAQLPTAARGSNGQIHLNGDHNGQSYIIDGVRLPESLNRALGDEIDTSAIGFLNVVQGAYPAQYGNAFGSVLDIATRTFAGPAGTNLSLSGGSYGLSDGTLDGHLPAGQGGSLVLSTHFSRDGRALDPATPNAPHNDGSTVSQFLRFSLPLNATDYLNLDVINALQTFQIPPDTANGAPASTDDNEYQNDTFVALQFRHAISTNAALSFGASYKTARLLDTNDLANDLAPAAGTTCTDFSDCNYFSVLADRSTHDYGLNLSYSGHSRVHEVQTGATVDSISVPKFYAITLQPGNALSPTGAAFTVTDSHTNRAFTQSLYAQDGWSFARDWRLDYGLRFDAFTIASDDFASAFQQISPRIKLTRFFGDRAGAYLYYGRLFVPFSFENVDPTVAARLYVAANAPGVTFDLKPQRDSLYEFGFHLPLGGADLGFRLSHKVSTDWIDDTQVGATNLHQEINFPLGRVDSQSISFQKPLAGGSRFYASLSHVLAVNSTNCETQLLQNCALAGPPGGDYAQADHDQHWDASAGLIANDRRGGWFSVTGEYGSGLSTDPGVCANLNFVNCKVPPHLTFDASKAFALGPGALIFSVQNVLDDRYAITLDNALQGTHWARPRSFDVRYEMRRR